MPLFAKSQVFRAGDPLSGYYDIIPDTLISHFNFYHLEDYSFDINNDGVNDFKIEGYSTGGLGSSINYINIIPFDSTCYILYSRKDSIHNTNYNNNYWQSCELAKALNYGDSLNSTSYVWKNHTISISNSSGATSVYLHSGEFVSTNDRYICIKRQTQTDTIYGWVRVNCPYLSQCYIKDYSFSKCLSVPPMTVTSSDSLSCASESVVLTANGASTYTWSNGSTGSNITVMPDTTTIYTVQAMNLYGCSAGTASFTQNVDACAGIKEYSTSELIIFPNPVLNVLQIKDEQHEFENTETEIRNYLGQLVLKQKFSHTMDVSHLIHGIYTLKVSSKDASYYSKFIKE